MAKLSAMPMFWTDFFADTEHLPDEAAKAYLFLLGHAWIRKAKLPNDDRALARLARISFKKWMAIRGHVMAFFELDEDGFLHNPRLTKEWKWVAQRVTHNRENGSLGGKENAAKKSNEINTTPVATATDSLKQPTPTPTPTPSKKVQSSLRSDSCDPFDLFWAGYPRKERKPAARKAFLAAVKRADAETIIEGACRYAEAAETAGVEKRYQPHPSTWLNGDAWNDPLPVARGPARPNSATALLARLESNLKEAHRHAASPQPTDPVDPFADPTVVEFFPPARNPVERDRGDRGWPGDLPQTGSRAR